MGLFSWLFGKKKKASVDADLDAEIDSISASENMNDDDEGQDAVGIEKSSGAAVAKTETKISESNNSKDNAEQKAISGAKNTSASATNNATSSAKSSVKDGATSNAKDNNKSSLKTASSEKSGSIKADESSSEKGTSRGGAIEVYKDAQGKFRFRIKASNACTVAHSQGYTSKASCKNGFVSISQTPNIIVVDTIVDKDYSPTIGKAVFEIYKDKEDKFRFRYRAANLNTILASQGYTTKANCINGINSVQKLLANYVIDDLTKKE